MACEPLNKNNSCVYTANGKGPLVTAEDDQWKEDGSESHRRNENSPHYARNVSVSPKARPCEKLTEKPKEKCVSLTLLTGLTTAPEGGTWNMGLRSVGGPLGGGHARSGAPLNSRARSNASFTPAAGTFHLLVSVITAPPCLVPSSLLGGRAPRLIMLGVACVVDHSWSINTHVFIWMFFINVSKFPIANDINPES